MWNRHTRQLSVNASRTIHRTIRASGFLTSCVVVFFVCVCVQWVKLRGSFCWYWWNYWPSLFKLSLHNKIRIPNLIYHFFQLNYRRSSPVVLGFGYNTESNMNYVFQNSGLCAESEVRSISVHTWKYTCIIMINIFDLVLTKTVVTV